MFNVLHARGHSQCRCNGRQHTNGCLNREFPKCLVLHNDLVFDFTLIDFFTLIFFLTTDFTDFTDFFSTEIFFYHGEINPFHPFNPLFLKPPCEVKDSQVRRRSPCLRCSLAPCFRSPSLRPSARCTTGCSA